MESSTQTTGGPAYPVQFSVEYPDRELNRLATRGVRLTNLLQTVCFS
jgi:hypothetical protein